MARRQKTGAETPGEASDNDKEKGAETSEADVKAAKTGERGEAPPAASRPDPKDLPDIAPAALRPDPKDLPDIVPPEPHAEPWPDATPPPMKPVEAPEVRASRTPTETMAMPLAGDLGRPPDMPQTTAPRPLALGEVENPTHMPGPKDIPAGNPDDPAPAPGLVPPGDSRSLRRGNQFALVYRVGSCVISRTGVLGTRGQWRVVEYPTSASASNSYAKECSRFVSEGFSDYRE